MSTKHSTPPSPKELGDRIVRNLEQVRGYIDVLQSEINDPLKSTGGGSRSTWLLHSQKLDASLLELKRILAQRDGEVKT